jgi:hypothetical protein
MWLAPVDKPTLEEALFHFLLSGHDGRPQAPQPLVAEQTTLRELYAAPHPDLCEALRHCLDALLVEMEPDPGQEGAIGAPVSVLAVALAAHNCLGSTSLLPQGEQAKNAELVLGFTAALIETVPPADEYNTALAYHAVLRSIAGIMPELGLKWDELLHALIDRSPLTALWALDAHMPAALDELATELLPGWRVLRQAQPSVWRNGNEWWGIVWQLLAKSHIRQWLRHRWLLMPETRQACRNVGLVLEALRRQGDHRDFILEFYAAYDYFRAQTRPDAWQGWVRFWPILETIEKLLRTPGDNEAAIRVNRWGNEYFLKFLSLMKIVIEEGGIPSDYMKLSRGFVVTQRRLLDYVTYGMQRQIAFGPVAFEGQNAQ